MTNATDLAYGMLIELPVGHDAALALTRDALASRGFGVLTEIDVRATLKKKLDAEFRPYVILGACNPPLAHQALSQELPIGLLLPCNVVVYAGDEPGTSVVAAIDPVQQLGLTGRAELEPVAAKVRSLLQEVLERTRRAAAQPNSKRS